MKVHPILQAEAAECGPACLAMIARARGVDVDLRQLRYRFPVSSRGAKLSQLMQMAAAIDLDARALRLELSDLAKLQTPAVLHWDFSHFVVLEHATASGAVIVDPGTGRRSVSTKELSERFTGVALELSASRAFVPLGPAKSLPLRGFLQGIGGLRRSVATIVALSAALQVFVVVSPFYLQWVVDQALVAADRDMLTMLGVGFATLLVIQVVTQTLRSLSIALLSSQVGVQWVQRLFSCLLRLPLAFFEKRHLGDVTSRMASLQSLQRGVTASALEALIDGVMAVITLSIMFAYSPRLGTVSIAVAMGYGILRWSTFRPLRETAEEQMISSAKQQSHLLESLRGIQSVKVTCGESTRAGAFYNLAVATNNKDFALQRAAALFGGASQLLFGGEKVAAVWLGALAALEGHFSVGMLIAYLAYRDQFASRVASLTDRIFELQMLRLHADRVSDLLLETPDVTYVDQHEMTFVKQRDIVVENVSFRHGPDDPWILRNVSFVVSEGEYIALVGPSGAGKSTLIKVMLGLLAPTEGRVLIGGQDVRGPTGRAMRSCMGAVLQDDQCFAGTIADNVTLFDPALDMKRIEKAARFAGIHEEISAMPMGYQSLIGDMGSVLSGGQKQRVLLARSLYREPKILFLDEATSHLDVARERAINHVIADLAITRIMAAHRPDAIAMADRRLVVANGSVIEALDGDLSTLAQRQPAAVSV